MATEFACISAQEGGCNNGVAGPKYSQKLRLIYANKWNSIVG